MFFLLLKAALDVRAVQVASVEHGSFQITFVLVATGSICAQVNIFEPSPSAANPNVPSLDGQGVSVLDPDTKSVPTWFVGMRDAGAAYHFMHDLGDGEKGVRR